MQPRGSRELIGPLSAKFGPEETQDWFRSKGVSLKTEADGRVFPTTDRSTTIIETLEREAKAHKVRVHCGARVVSLHANDEMDSTDTETSSRTAGIEDKQRYTLGIKYSNEDQPKHFECDSVIFATGSARPGHKMLSELGHKLAEPLPSLFSFKIADPALTSLSGLSLQQGRIKLALPKSFVKGPHKSLLRGANMASSLEQSGPILITHQGLSGPAILRLSAYGAKIMAALKYKFDVQITWIPNVRKEDVVSHMSSLRKRFPTR
jgi:predicted flavoprotein YhiN